MTSIAAVETEDDTADLPNEPEVLRPIPKFRPFNEFVLVRDLSGSGEKRTKGGIIIPTQYASKKDELAEVEVVRVSTGVLKSNGDLREPRVKEGQHLVVAQSNLQRQGPQHWGDERVYVITEDDIIGVVEPESAAQN